MCWRFVWAGDRLSPVQPLQGSSIDETYPILFMLHISCQLIFLFIPFLLLALLFLEDCPGTPGCFVASPPPPRGIIKVKESSAKFGAFIILHLA